jgi:hypothetical protein
MTDIDILIDDQTASAESPSVNSDAPHWRREHFIPIRKAELIRLLAADADLTPQDREGFLQFCGLLEATFHREYYDRLEELKNDYAPLNPDSVTKELDPPDTAARDAIRDRLFSNVVELLDRANYHRLTRAEIEEAVGVASKWGVRLHVDFDVFERLEVFSRGDVVGQREFRNWRKFNRVEKIDVPIYQRLVVVFQLRDHQRLDEDADTKSVYLKLFKNIPKQDVDMLLPGADFKMSMVDHGKIILPTLSGLIMALVKGLKAAMFALFGGFWGILAFLGFVGGAAGYGVKSFMGYLRTKDKYQLNLTRSLYYQNLDNNAGVLFRLFDEAEEQDGRETILAYALLRRRSGRGGWMPSELDIEAEQYLRELLGFKVDFEVSDALRMLEQLGCATRTEDGRWRALDLPEAIAVLNQRPADSAR